MNNKRLALFYLIMCVMVVIFAIGGFIYFVFLNESEMVVGPIINKNQLTQNQNITIINESVNEQPSALNVKIAVRDSRLGYGYGIPDQDIIKKMAELGTGAVKFGSRILIWGKIEAKPPKNGQHFYNWQNVDKVVKEFQTNKDDLYFVTRSASKWAGEESESHDWPPESDYLDDYGEYIYNLVERYDGDGVNDMPGLINPIKSWGVGSEVQHRGMWGGTGEEYAEVLEIAYQNIRKADPEAKVVLAGINTGECIKEDSSINFELLECELFASKVASQRSMEFIKSNLGLCQYFDIIDIHANHSWQGIPDTVSFIEAELAKNNCPVRPIWAGDLLSAVKIEHSMSNGDEVLAKLEANDQSTIEWYRIEQQRHAVKKVVVSLANGIEKVFVELPVDNKDANFPTGRYLGLINDDLSSRPVFNSYQLLISKIANFESVKRVASQENIWLYEFAIDGSLVYIAWGEGDFDNYIKGKVKITDIDGNESFLLADEVVLSASPIFIE